MRIVHFHLAKTAGKSLYAAMLAHLGKRAINFNAAKQDEFLATLDATPDWRAISGHLSGAHRPVRARLIEERNFFVVLRDPVDRFYSAYNYIKKIRQSSLYEPFNRLDPVAAAALCVEQKVDYGRSSQCSGVVWDWEKPATFEAALAAIGERYAFVCTLEQIAQAAVFLADAGVIASPDALPHVNKTSKLDADLRRRLRDVLEDAVADDAKLYGHVRDTGPIGHAA